MSAAAREKRLTDLIGGYRGVLVAFSGGVDSSYLAWIAHRALGTRALAVTALSPAVSDWQRALAADFASRYGLNHRWIDTAEMSDPSYTSNPANRCFFCKTELYSRLGRLKEELGLDAVFDGTNADDVADYRPGRAAAREHGVVSPLCDVGMSKAEIRRRARRHELPCWDLPAMPCLASRFPYGTEITAERLAQVERAEGVLRELGFREFRVRHYDALARLEIATAELERLERPEVRRRIETSLRKLGYDAVEVDPRGFRSGSLNDDLHQVRQ